MVVFAALRGAIVIAVLALFVPQQEKDLPVILAVGDSMTAGFGVGDAESYPAQLEKALDARGLHYRVVNSGQSASTTSQILDGLSRGLALAPSVVLIQGGGNDAESGIRQDASTENLKKMIRLSKSARRRVFFLGGRFSYLDDAAKAEGIPVIPFLSGVEGHRDLLLDDGRHPNAAGYAVVVRNIFSALDPAIR